MSQEQDMEARLQKLEAIQEITNLESQYAFAADTRQVDIYVNLFTEDGVIDLRPYGERIMGREAIRRFREASPEKVAFSVHYLHNPHIVVDGNRAWGRFYWLAALNWAATNEAVWSSGYYEDKFVKTDEGWKIKEKVMIWFFRTPYDKGWVKEKIMGGEKF
ncbi:MAG: nuclear transport factor 2 family protein [Chloroflexi bacterium]|nr:nuclear transport factor 2 family protein [Chloroflexota bacterium]